MIYEPWTPHEGQIVKVQLSPECRHRRKPAEDPSGLSDEGHYSEENGMVGVVAPWPLPEHPPTDGHNYAVLFLGHVLWVTRQNGTRDWMDGAAYAASELAPVEMLEKGLERMSFDPRNWPVIRDDPAYIIYQAPKGIKNVAILRDRCIQCGSTDRVETVEEQRVEQKRPYKQPRLETEERALCHDCRLDFYGTDSHEDLEDFDELKRWYKGHQRAVSKPADRESELLQGGPRT